MEIARTRGRGTRWLVKKEDSDLENFPPNPMSEVWVGYNIYATFDTIS